MNLKFSRRIFLKNFFFLSLLNFFYSKALAKDNLNLKNFLQNDIYKDEISLCMIDLKTKKVISSFNEDIKLPLASVSKAITASYVLENIGESFKFKTSLLYDGVIENNQLNGNLYLVGGSDPTLSIENLFEMVKKLKKKGIKRINGKFFVDDTFINSFENIDNEQPEEASYNPGFSGLNLNGNKIFFKWKKNISGFKLTLYAIGKTKKYIVKNISINSKKKQKSPYLHQISQDLRKENWTVFSKILNKEGGRWLPVSLSTNFASSVFISISEEFEIKVPEPELRKCPSNAKVIANNFSDELKIIIKEMLKKSTNMTAEVVGIFTAKIWGINVKNLKESGFLMSSWFNLITNTSDNNYVNHSGLSIKNKASSNSISKFLSRDETERKLSSILKVYKNNNQLSKRFDNKNFKIVAKTGTMFFVRGLAGYILLNEKPIASFTILNSNNQFRKKVNPKEAQRPKSSKKWLIECKNREKEILFSWLKILNKS